MVEAECDLQTTQYHESCHDWSLALASLSIILPLVQAPRSLTSKCNKDDSREEKLYSKPGAQTSCVPLPFLYIGHITPTSRCATSSDRPRGVQLAVKVTLITSGVFLVAHDMVWVALRAVLDIPLVLWFILIFQQGA